MRIRTLTAAAAVTLTALSATIASGQNPKADENWDILHINEEGEEVRKGQAFESVAIVEGPRNLRLEVGCNRNDRRFLRVRKVLPEGSNNTPDILGERFRPLISVFYRGDEIYSERQERWEYNEKRGSYQGRNDRELNDAISRGLRLVMEAPQQDWRAPFSLDGSMKALEKIDCR
ncbi:MAG: hypothetical protein AAGB10_20585 [Pseudomonadota bacterium]